MVAAAGPGLSADADARALAAVEHTLARRARGDIGFFDLPEQGDALEDVERVLAGIAADIDTMVVFGIGGSSLGPRALVSALTPPWSWLAPADGRRRRVLFCDNIDPVTVAGLFATIDVRRCVFNVVTKSGATAETCAQLLLLLERLGAVVGERVAQHLIITTDPSRGALRALASAHHLPSLRVPANVGGRFSVLSPVGLLPAGFAGVDLRALLRGAAAMRERVLRNHADNPALFFARHMHHQHMVAGRPMLVMMAYVDGLYDTADWFRQLWAESLGKALATDGRAIHVGPTPIAARGATDQHSQLQLYAEGPDDKAYCMLTVDDRGADLTMPAHPWAAAHDELAYLQGRGLGELLDAELRGTMASLRRRGRPVGIVRLAGQDAASVGELIMLLEAATAFAGPLYGVDPFDQPGVEEAKRLAFAALGRPGFSDGAVGVDVATILTSDPAHVR